MKRITETHVVVAIVTMVTVNDLKRHLGSSNLAQLTRGPTHRHTDHATCHICSYSLSLQHICTACRRFGIKNTHSSMTVAKSMSFEIKFDKHALVME